MEIELTFSRKTNKNYYKRYYAKDGLDVWCVFTNMGAVTKVIKRSFTSSTDEEFIEKETDPKELPLAITNFIKRST